MERGGVELLLTLYRLPRLPPTFGSTNASHSLLVTFRVFSQQQQLPQIFGLLRAALLKVRRGCVGLAALGAVDV